MKENRTQSDDGGNDKSQGDDRHRGRLAEKPTEIPKPGWRDIGIRVKNSFTEDHVSMLAAGVAFFIFVGMIPGLAALISIYGLAADPAQVREQVATLSGVLPEEVRTILEEQMTRIAGDSGAAGLGAVIGLLLALWSGSAAMKGLMEALNIIYDERERRGFIKLTAAALGLTLVVIFLGILAIGLVVVVPMVLGWVGLGSVGETLINVLRWPLLAIIAIIGMGIVYRYGPSRDEPRWNWVSSGAVLGTLLVVAGSALFSLYVSKFADYNETYGSLGAVVVLLLWLYVSAFGVLLGAEVNSAMEHQTKRDTTKGEPQPMGQRDAHVADTLGETPEK